jgi:non-ribosomal peptide synthetase component F
MSRSGEAGSNAPTKKSELLDLLLKKRGIAAPRADIIPRREGQGPCPLSYGQQRLWFLDRLSPGTPLYNVPAAARLSGRLDLRALARALAEICRRHEALRTTFSPSPAGPVQLVGPAPAPSLPVIDLSSLPEAERESSVRRLAAEEASRPFDLAAGPLLRAAVLRVGEREHVALLTTHHIVSDGWSMGVLLRELGALYAAYEAGLASPLQELPVQYADYAVWQRRWLTGEALERQLAYWRAQLSGVEPVEVAGDRARPAAQTHRGAHATFELDAGVSAGVGALARREGATPFMVLLAGYAALLYRVSGRWDVSVGTPIAGRVRRELEGLIGFFVNTLVVRVRGRGGMSFRELVGEAREACVGAYAHQDVPFDYMVNALNPTRSADENPLYRVSFGLHHRSYVGEGLELPGITVTPLGSSEEMAAVDTAQVDLSLNMWEAGDDIGGTFRYDVSLYDAATIERLSEGLKFILRRASEDPELSLETLSRELTGEEERRQAPRRETFVRYRRQKLKETQPKPVRG